MRSIFLFLFFFSLSFSSAINPQAKTEEDIDIVYQNAKKGIYWALENIPDKKTKLETDLIVDDKLLASIKLEKEINGIKIESIGYYQSNSVPIKIYKSYDSLVKEGHLKRIPSDNIE